MAFEDYTKVVDPLVLPINGKKYVIPEVGVADGIKFTLAAEKAANNPDSSEPVMGNDEFYQLFLGTAYDEMVADNVPGPAVLRAATTAMTDFQAGRQLAEIMWTTGGDPKAVEKYLQPNRAARRSKNSGEAKETPPQAYTNGTTTALIE